MGSSQSTPFQPTGTMNVKPPSALSLVATPAQAAPSATASDNTSRPKPCCVCKDEKSKRDECMLFSNAKDPAADCRSFVDQYKSCMAGFGYNV